MMEFFMWLYWWLVKTVLMMGVVVSATCLAGGSIWLALTIAFALAFLAAVGVDHKSREEPEHASSEEANGVAVHVRRW